MKTNFGQTELDAVANHPWTKRVFIKLTPSDLEIVNNFLAEHRTSTKSEYFYDMVRMFLGNPNKPKNWKYIEEILSCTGTRIYKED